MSALLDGLPKLVLFAARKCFNCRTKSSRSNAAKGCGASTLPFLILFRKRFSQILAIQKIPYSPEQPTPLGSRTKDLS